MSPFTALLHPAPDRRLVARRRLQALASQLTPLAPPTAPSAGPAWAGFAAHCLGEAAGVEAFPASTLERLAAFAFTPAADAWLARPAHDELFAQLPGLGDADTVTAWLALDTLRAQIVHLRAHRAFAARAPEVARELTALLKSLYGQGPLFEPNVDFDELGAALETTFRAWADHAPRTLAATAPLEALHQLERNVFARFRAGTACWHLLIHNFEQHPAFADTVAPALIEPLLAALPRLEFLQQLETVTRTQPPAAGTFLPWLRLHVILSAAPASGAASALAQQLEPAAIDALLAPPGRDTLLALGTAVRATLRATLEQHQVDLWTDAVTWLERVAAAATLPAPVALTDLQAAQPEAPVDDLVALAVRLAATSLDSGVAQALFRQGAVADLGVEPARGESASGGSVTGAALLEALPARGLPLPLLAARPLLRALDGVVGEVSAWPLPSRAAFGEHAPLLRRLALEHRRARPGAALQATFAWYRREVVPALAEPPSPHLPSTWPELASAETLPPLLREATVRLAARWPRFTAGLRLVRTHEVIAQAVTTHALARLPDYRARIGERGIANCRRDNTLSLRKLGLLLLAGGDTPAEDLAVWWTSLVGAYLVNRPPQLFEANLLGLHAGLSEHLPPAELDVAFPLLHQVYKEAVGAADCPLLFFNQPDDAALRPAASLALATGFFPAGDARKAWFKRLSALVAPGQPGLADAAQAFAAAFEAAAPRATSLQSLWALLRRALTAWLDAAPAESVARALAALAAEGARRPDYLGRALASFSLLGVDLVSQSLVARRIANGLPTAPAELRGFLDVLAQQLATRSAPLALANSLRFLVESTAALHDRPADHWRGLFDDWRQGIVAEAGPLERTFAEEVGTLFYRFAPSLTDLHSLCRHSFKTGNPVFASTPAREKALRAAFSTTLLRTLAPTEGRWPRDVLFAAAVHHAAVDAAPGEASLEALVQHLDTLFDHLPGEIYYELLEELPRAALDAAQVARPNVTASLQLTALHAAVGSPVRTAGLLRALTSLVSGPRPAELANDLWRASAMALVAREAGLLDAPTTGAVLRLLPTLVPAEFAGEFTATGESLRTKNPSTELATLVAAVHAPGARAASAPAPAPLALGSDVR